MKYVHTYVCISPLTVWTVMHVRAWLQEHVALASVHVWVYTDMLKYNRKYTVTLCVML